MPKPVAETGNKNLIGSNLIALRKKHHLSQRALAHELQLKGYDIDKNVIKLEPIKFLLPVSATGFGIISYLPFKFCYA